MNQHIVTMSMATGVLSTAAQSTLPPLFKWTRIVGGFRAGARAFFVGYSAQFVVKLILRSITRKGKMISVKHELELAGGADSLQFATFLAGFTGTYRTLLPVLLRLRGRKTGNAALAGFIAALAIYLDKNKGRRYTIALYMCARTMDAYFQHLVKKGIVSPVPHGAFIGFALCQMPIQYAFMVEPHLISRSYYKSITKWYGNFTEPILDGHIRGKEKKFKECQDGYHPDQICSQYLAEDFVRGVIRSYKIYAPLVLLPVLLMNGRRLFKQPYPVLTRAAEKWTRSALFLATYSTVMKTLICYIRNRSKRASLTNAEVMGAGFCTGSSLLWENAGRHRELMLYCLPRSMEAIFTKVMEHLKLPMIPNGDVLVFALAAAPMLSLFETYPTDVPGLTRTVLTPLFASKGVFFKDM